MARKKKQAKVGRATKLFNELKKRVSILEELETQGRIELARLKKKLPNAAEGREILGRKLLDGLRSLGVATQSDLKALKKTIQKNERPAAETPAAETKAHGTHDTEAAPMIAPPVGPGGGEVTIN